MTDSDILAAIQRLCILVILCGIIGKLEDIRKELVFGNCLVAAEHGERCPEYDK